MYILPEPQSIQQKAGCFFFSYDAEIVIGEEWEECIYDYAKILQKAIEDETGFKLNIYKGSYGGAAIVFDKREQLRTQEYRIDITPQKVVLSAAEKSGLFYAIQTWKQIVQQCGASIPCVEIVDYPATEVRGFYYDVTRGRIPTVDYLKKVIDRLACYKINQFQLYIEHSYMFRDLSEMWRDDTPLTSDEILEIDAYCSARNIELVPGIASFGHLYKLLRTKGYRHLCEAEALCDEPYEFVSRMEHHTIDVSNEESFRLIASMIDEYASLFQSNKFNICCDETMDLGKGKGKKLADKIGIPNMYMGYVRKLCNYLKASGKTPMFWGDIILKFPEKIRELPPDTICLNWGYDKNEEEESSRVLHEAGANLYNCPGVSGWDQFVNRIEISYHNIKTMCEYGRQYGAIGVLNTDWGDCGHVNHPDMSVIGIIYGACFSWSSRIPSFEDINHRISVIEFRDKEGQLVSLLSDISELWECKWRDLVNLKENRGTKMIEYDSEKIMKSIDLLYQKKVSLLNYIGHLDGREKAVVRPYVIAIDGMILLQQIGLFFGDCKSEQSDRSTANKLASAWEKWFMYYKDEWRRVSREGELHRLSEVVFWTADRIRERYLPESTFSEWQILNKNS